VSSEAHTDAGALRGLADLRALAGVIVWTEASRFPAMLEFYRDTLALTPRSLRDDFVSFNWGSTDPDATRLNIVVHSEVLGRARDPLRFMLNFLVDDIDIAYDQLRALGVRFLRPPTEEHFGGRIATFEDPDGNLLQLLQHPRET
jgi:catechol 2,3-dioxygenase-like lactoylglutathione lyase family enzyme